MVDPQRFEGSSIEEVLAEVRATLGADAEIIEANKVRSGGLGGFFAKETFEVLATPVGGGAAARPAATAEGPAADAGRPAWADAALDLPAGIDPAAFDAAHAHVTRAAGRGPADRGAPAQAPSLADLADRVSAAEQAGGATAPSAPGVVEGLAAQVEGTRPRSRAELVAQQAVEAHLRAAGAQPTTTRAEALPPTPFQPLAASGLPRISTEVPAFTDVLQRMAADVGPEIARAVGPDPVVAAPPVAGQPVAGQPIAMTPPPATSSPVVQPSAPASTPALPPPPPAPVAEVPAAAEAAPIETAEPEPSPAEAAPIEAAEPEPAPTPTAVEVHAIEHDDRTARLLSWLERDNLPRTTLTTALRSLPQMPELPQTTGLVVAVVGERRAALKLCRQMAKAWEGADPDDVVLASRTYSGRQMAAEQRIVDVTDAARERLAWRRRTVPTFVAVECPTGLREAAQEWTRQIIDGLEAHQVIGIVRADRKVEDVSRWIERVGGVDGIALQGLDETSTPYAVLVLEVPVAFLDDVRATPASWASALLEGAST